MCWLMVLPSGRWNGHYRVEDGKWLMLLPLGRCYGKSLSLSTKIDSVLEKYLSYIMTNRMRSIHMNKWYYHVSEYLVYNLNDILDHIKHGNK